MYNEFIHLDKVVVPHLGPKLKVYIREKHCSRIW